MSLILSDASVFFNLESIRKGDFIRAMHGAWESPQNGIIADATAEKLYVMFVNGTGRTTNYFIINAKEVATEWDIRWSHDLDEIFTEGDAI